ncbi:FAD-dependent oxidoreductase [Azospirillum brasilense]|uniref:FAD-dependent oxidoreductase n=1 Tax=Azospirillum brasilense TaxID=192 RepID=UPI000E0AE425|nr:GMC family oxidoreductase [Azospirillum brasilense]
MILDARSVSSGTNLDADLCIVGAGAAGLAIARALAGSRWKIVLLESGGLDPDGHTQSLYAGENLGLPYERLSTARSRYFGGSTNCWGGFCRPFEPIDMEARPWVPNSGWPFGPETLAPYYARAHSHLNLPSNIYDNGHWEQTLAPDGIELMPVEGGALENRIAQISDQPRVGVTSVDEIVKAANIACYLNANVTEFETNDTATVVERVRCAALSGARFTVTARQFVLCCGGIENARLLLLSNRVQSAGLGNGHDLVGRYFTDHPRIKAGSVRLTDQARHRRLYDMTLTLSRRRLNAKHLPVSASLSPTVETQRRLGLMNSRSYLVAQYHGEATAGVRALHDLRMLMSDRRKFGHAEGDLKALLREAVPQIALHLPNLAYAMFDNVVNPAWVTRSFLLETIVEPVPNPDSRVTLAAERDALGLNRADTVWRLTEQDRDNFLRTNELVRTELTRNGLITVTEADPQEAAERAWAERISWCWHHMGTTRMHDDPKQGVVDARCKVHGMHNLYIGGSSVFPSMGCDHPTINLVALAFRLAEEVSAQLQHDRAVTLEGQQAA